MTWPDGPRFRVTEIRGYAFRTNTGQRGGSTRQSSSFSVVDDAYRCVIRSFDERPGRSRKTAEGLALYVCAALNIDETSYIGGLGINSLNRRLTAGYAPNWRSPRLPKVRR